MARAEFLTLLFLLAMPTGAPTGQGAIPEGKPLGRTVQLWQDMRASDLIGARVAGADGSPSGRIEDLILSAESGAAHYAVVSSGGLLELGDHHHIYPIGSLKPGPSKRVVRLESSRPPHPAAAQDLADWLRDYDPGQALADRRFVRASSLLAKAIASTDGTRVGEVEDMVLNLGSGALRFVEVEAQGPNGRTMALPLTAFYVPILRDRPLVLK
jgi:sporulation protein YlmC with PRC-barrel domain